VEGRDIGDPQEKREEKELEGPPHYARRRRGCKA